MEKKISIWHNPRCGKSRGALKYLEQKGFEAQVRRYLENPPTKEELKNVLTKLGMKPSELIRKKETLFKELGLKEASEEELLDAMVQYPKLIERPIVIVGDKAVVARPEENIDAIV